MQKKEIEKMSNIEIAKTVGYYNPVQIETTCDVSLSVQAVIPTTDGIASNPEVVLTIDEETFFVTLSEDGIDQLIYELAKCKQTMKAKF